MSSRRICWPNPDATCLEGGCSYCNDYPYKSLTKIKSYAENAGILLQRAKGEALGIDAYMYGYQTGWPNIDVKWK